MLFYELLDIRYCDTGIQHISIQNLAIFTSTINEMRRDARKNYRLNHEKKATINLSDLGASFYEISLAQVSSERVDRWRISDCRPNREERRPNLTRAV